MDAAWLSWVDALIRLTAEGRLPPMAGRPLPPVGGSPFLDREQQAFDLNGFLDRIDQGWGGSALIAGPAGGADRPAQHLSAAVRERASRPGQDSPALPSLADPMACADMILGIRAGLLDIVPPGDLLDFDRQAFDLALNLRSAYHLGASPRVAHH